MHERPTDIPILVEYFVHRLSKRAGKKITGISSQTLELLQSYPWPGNIRELQNVVERAVIVADGELFTVDSRWLAGRFHAIAGEQTAVRRRPRRQGTRDD